jgi:hypothetical protein
MKWFGKPGTGAAFAGCEQTETPVGDLCRHCHEPINEGEDGWLIPSIDYGAAELAFHHACHLRQIIGSVAHQQRRCSCYGGTASGEEDGMTRREGAEAALRYFEGHGQQNQPPFVVGQYGN